MQREQRIETVSSKNQKRMTAKRALLIGPSYSPDLPTFCGPLEGVQNDLRLMESMLNRNGFQIENMKVLEGDMASHSNILSSLEELSSTAERGSVVVIYFSGHGYELGEEFDQGLLPAGLTPQMVSDFQIYDVCITGKHFKPHLLKLIQKDCLVNTIFDCCFSGRMYRGFEERDGHPLTPKQLAFSKEYSEQYREKLESRGWEHRKQPVEHDMPMEHGPSQETQPPSPMDQQILLDFPVQEFWTPMLKSQGWRPSQHDKFISIAASAANERGYETLDPNTGLICGCLTSVLVEVIDEVPDENKKISYNVLKSLIKRKFAERKLGAQTPQFEGGNMNLVLFSFDTVPQPKTFEICESEEEEPGFKKVVLNAGKLHGVVDGEYDVYGPEIQGDDVSLEVIGVPLDRIIINHDDIGMLKSRGKTVFVRDDKGSWVGHKAVLRRRRSMFTPVFINPNEAEAQVLDRMYLAIENQNMFAIETEERPHCITLDIQTVEEKKCWRARQYGRMIAPYQETGDEHLMAKNLSKYFRHKFAIMPKQSNPHMLTHVSFKVFKVENVPSFKGSPDKKTELIALATNTNDLSLGDPPYHVPTFRAHKVELVTTMFQRSKYKVVDGSGDALVIQVTNYENSPIHVCVISYQADGSIVILHPPKKGHTEVLKPFESTTTIKRILLEPDTVRRMIEPDFMKKKPSACSDVLILYATTAQTDYEPLTQTAIELSPKLSTRGPNPPDGLRLATVHEFRTALEPPREKLSSARDGHPKWLTIKREISILYNEDPEGKLV